MAVVRYSVRAERDLTVIADYTLKRWGEDQVIRYSMASRRVARTWRCYRLLDGRVMTSGPAFGEHQGMLPGRQPMEDD